MEVMNESRRKKRLQKEASELGQQAAEAAAPSKRVRLLESASKDVFKVDENSDADDDANADIVVSLTKEEREARHVAAKKASKQHMQEQKTVSKTKQKALQRLQERKERESKRSQLYESLAKHAIDAKETELLRSSAKLGVGRDTKKQRLTQALKESRVGVNLTDATGLLVSVHKPGKKKKMEEAEEDDDDDDTEEEDAEEDKPPEVGAAMQAPPEPKVHIAEMGATKPQTKTGKARANKAEKAATPAKVQRQSVPLPRDVPAERKPAFYVRVNRKPQLQQGREKLPIFAEEQPIMEALKENDVLILCGATGCGKSTQLPQFLYEAGYGDPAGVPGMIGCTQPRRVAAITTAKRVALELNLPLGHEVGYQVHSAGCSLSRYIHKWTVPTCVHRFHAHGCTRTYACVNTRTQTNTTRASPGASTATREATHAHARTHAHTHAHARTHTHTGAVRKAAAERYQGEVHDGWHPAARDPVRLPPLPLLRHHHRRGYPNALSLSLSRSLSLSLIFL
jgi:hypothetical protein